MTTKIAIPIL